MKITLRLLFLSVFALLAAACATQVSVTPTTAPAASAPDTESAAAEAVPVSGKPKFIDSFADW
jgi:hypothetical protein